MSNKGFSRICTVIRKLFKRKIYQKRSEFMAFLQACNYMLFDTAEMWANLMDKGIIGFYYTDEL